MSEPATRHPTDPNEIELSFAPSPGASVRAVLIDDEAVLFDESQDRFHVLDRIGALVWQCFDGVSTLHELCGDLADGFDAPLAAVESDVLALTQAFGAAGLLDGVVPPVVDEWGEQVMDEAPVTDPRFVGPPPSL